VKGLQDIQLQPLAQGHHNVIYLADNPASQLGLPSRFVARVPRLASVIEGADQAGSASRQHHKRNNMLDGLPTPQVLYFGRFTCGLPISFEEYATGQHMDFDDLPAPAIRAFATAISEVHSRQSSAFSNNSGCEPICSGNYADYLWAMVEESVDQRLAAIEDLSPYAEAIELISIKKQELEMTVQANAASFAGSRFSLLHHDLSRNNVMWCPNGGISLIDWNPTYGDPADDLDYIFTDNNTSLQFKQSFLESYQPPAGSGDVYARLQAYTLKNRLDDLAWSMTMRQAIPKEYHHVYEGRLRALQTTTVASLLAA